MSGTLYICATPIGNMEDITLRVLRVLKECDAVACEDTRHSAVLLRHYDIHKPLLSYHEHNEQQRSEQLLERLAAGENIALLSDAGMPCISDPGYIAVRKARERGFPVTVLPGANAGLCALVLSGMRCDRFVFEGFLPKTGKERRQRLEELAKEERTVILHESPHRLENTLEELFQVLGDREAALARELTKLHEECILFSLSRWRDAVENLRGEFVLILAGKQQAAEASFVSPREQVAALIAQGIEKRRPLSRWHSGWGYRKMMFIWRLPIFEIL